MRHRFSAIDRPLHDSVLIHPDRGQHVEGVLVTGVNSIKNQATHDLLPGRPSFVPEFRSFQIDDIPNILHHSVQGSCRQDLVFIVIRDGDQELCVSVIHGWPQIVAIAQAKLVRIAGGRRVYTRVSILPGPRAPRPSHSHRKWVNSSGKPSSDSRYCFWIAFWIALGTG